MTYGNRDAGRGIGIDARRAQAMILLEEATGGGRVLPVWLAPSDAAALELARQHHTAPRPSTHGLLAEVITRLGGRLDRPGYCCRSSVIAGSPIS